MNVVIVGGGIGGVATALAMESRGIGVTLIEQAKEIAEVGAGLWVAPNSVKVLRELGVENRLREHAVECLAQTFHRLEDDEVILHTELGDASVERYGATSYFAHRADLLAALFGGLGSTTVRLGSRVDEVGESGGRPWVRLASGEVIETDLVIGADGVKSIVREYLHGASEPRFTGMAAWRSVMPFERVQQIGFEPDVQHAWFGPGRSVLGYPLRNNTLYNFVGFVPAAEIKRESWSSSGDVGDMPASFEGSCSAVAALIGAIDEAFITGLYFRDPLSTWHRGNVVLLGDAAHPALPTAGQGATLAIEDAVTLAECLCRTERVSDALADYQDRRLSVTVRVLERARTSSWQMNLGDRSLIKARDGRYRGLRAVDPEMLAQYGWMWRQDAAAAARRPMSETSADNSAAVRRTRPEAARAARIWSEVLTFEARSKGWIGEREAYGEFWSGTPVADAAGGARRLTDLDAILVGPADTGVSALLLHGGGYVMGSAEASLELASRLAKAIDGEVLVPDYRLAPEHPAPAALDDTLAAYRWLLDNGRRPEDIVFFGEGAGGGLAISLALAARAAGLAQPAGIHVVSPLSDLAVGAQALSTRPSTDPWLTWDRLTWMAASYVQDSDPTSWQVSPTRGDLAGLAPLLVHYAAEELLAPEIEDLVRRASEAGVLVGATKVEDSVPSFVLFAFLPESTEALRETARLVRGERMHSTISETAGDDAGLPAATVSRP